MQQQGVERFVVVSYSEPFSTSRNEADMTNINAFYILKGPYIDGTMNYIKETYGNMDTYLEKRLGLGTEEIAQLKKLLLE